MIRPHDNCYWVVPQQLMAGEYPAASLPDQSWQKLAALACAGIRHFIDLTQRYDPLTPYQSMLADVARATHTELSYDRFGIMDLGVPDSPELTNAILDRIDALIAQRKATYVHCWGGVGRTGTVIGCWLVRHGKSWEEALETIARHWETMAKRSRYPRSPETERQMHYVRQWLRHDKLKTGR